MTIYLSRHLWCMERRNEGERETYSTLSALFNNSLFSCFSFAFHYLHPNCRYAVWAIKRSNSLALCSHNFCHWNCRLNF